MDPLDADRRSAPIGYSADDDPYALPVDRPNSLLFESGSRLSPPALSTPSPIPVVASSPFHEEVSIQITDASLGKHVIYRISGQDRSGVFEIERRYSDFFALRGYFVHRWPGVFIPPVPPKKIIVSYRQGNKAESNIASRKKLLEEFLRKTVAISFLWKSDEFQMFIRGTSNFKGTSAQLKRYSTAEISEIYRKEFSEFANHEVSPDIISGLGVYQQFFKGVLDSLREFKKVAKTAANYYSAFHENYSRLADCFSVFEENCLCEYSAEVKRPVFLKWSAPLALNPYQVIYDWLKMEKLDVKAMLEALARREELQGVKERMEGKMMGDNADLNKLQAGKSTVSGFFSRKPKETQISALQTQIAQEEGDLSSLGEALSIITTRLHAYEIPRFKELKADKYEMVMKSFATLAVSEYEEVIKVCRAIEANLPGERTN